MNPPTLDLATIALALKDCRVDFVVIGGAGAHAWGASRRPQDLDVVIRRAWDNFEGAAAALRQLNARAYFPEFGADALEHLPKTRLTAELIEMSTISTWMTNHGELDLFDSVLARGGPARYWEDIHPGSTRRRVGGIPVDVASIDTLIASKVAVGRPHDLETAAELRRIAADRALSERSAPADRKTEMSHTDMTHTQPVADRDSDLERWSSQSRSERGRSRSLDRDAGYER